MYDLKGLGLEIEQPSETITRKKTLTVVATPKFKN